MFEHILSTLKCQEIKDTNVTQTLRPVRQGQDWQFGMLSRMRSKPDSLKTCRYTKDSSVSWFFHRYYTATRHTATRLCIGSKFGKMVTR